MRARFPRTFLDAVLVGVGLAAAYVVAGWLGVLLFMVGMFCAVGIGRR